ncbi:MAG: hypothetical protein HYY20_08960, partial [Candidatus Tectomicrobia bacterium]|nr:hypothetical protein [Candidatus Tectomicrobia bacterium]
MKIPMAKGMGGAVLLGILLSLSWPCGAVEWEKLGQLNDHWRITGSLRARQELWHWFDPGDLPRNDNNTYDFTAFQLRLGLKYQSDPLEGLVEVQDTRLLGLPSDAGAQAPQGPLGLGAIYFAHNRDQDQGRTSVKQAYLHWKGLGKSLGLPGLSLKAGRFEYLDGLEVLTGEPTLD